MNYVVGDLAQPVHGEKITVKDIVQCHCQRCDEALTDPENTGRLLRGALSDLLPAWVAQDMTRRGPRAELIEFPNIGHLPPLLSQEQIKPIATFLKPP